MIHNIESITQTLFIVGTQPRIIESLHQDFSDAGWFVLSEADQNKAFKLLTHLSVSVICVIDEHQDMEAFIQALKAKTDALLFVLSDHISAKSRLNLYQNGVNHIFSSLVNALEIRTVIASIQQQTMLQSSNTEPLSLPEKRWQFCAKSRMLMVDDTVISLLSYNEAKVLKMLIDNVNESLSRERLMMALGRFQITPQDRTLDRLICNLRKKFKKICPDTQFILSLYGHGYVFTHTG